MPSTPAGLPAPFTPRGGRLDAIPETPDTRVPVVYASALLTGSGRVCDRAVLSALGWDAGTPILVAGPMPGIATIDRADRDADHKVTATLQIPVPAAVRRRIGLRVGDRVLLAAHPDRDRLILVCRVALDAILASIRDALEPGNPR